MPMYSYTCLQVDCDNTVTQIKKIDERDEYPVCDVCEAPMKRNIDRPGLVYAPTAGGMR